jgi:hypothetical protein
VVVEVEEEAQMITTITKEQVGVEQVEQELS